MRSTWYQFSVLTIAMATVIALAAPAESFAQRGGGGGHGGGRGGGGHGGGHGGGGGHGVGRGGGGGGGPSHAGPRGGGGGGRGNSGPSWSGGNRGGGNWDSGPSGRQQYYGNLGNPGGGSRNYYRGGSPSLNQLYRGYYSSGYRGNVYGYGRPGFGPSYGRYGYGYFPWYVGLAAYGLNANRGYGSTNGYVASSAAVIVEQSGQPTSQPAQPADDYVPQLNRTTTVLGAQPSGAAVLGVTMDPQYAEAAVVRTVTPGSAAEKAGLRPGDMITTINGAEIRSPADVTNFVASQEAGAQVEMEFIRPILRSEVKEAAPEQGLGVTAPQPAAAPTLAEPAGETIPPPVPQPAAN